LLTDRQNERQRRKQITSLAETRREDYEKNSIITATLSVMTLLSKSKLTHW